MRVGVRAGLSVDHLVTVEAGAKYSQLGGPGLYACLGARLVAETTPVLLAGVPEDDLRFAQLFDDLRIDFGAVPAVPSVPALWILTAPEGRRVVSVSGSIELDAQVSTETEPEVFPDVDDLGLGGLLISNPPMADIKTVPGAVLAVDPDQAHIMNYGWDYLRRVTRPGSVILPSRVHLRLIDPDPRAAVAELADRLRSSVVARLDKDGMYVVDGSRAWALSDDRVLVEETTGAGDASAGGIVAALAAGRSIAEAAAFGMSVARIALSGWGSHSLAHAAPLSSPFSNIKITEVNP